MDEQLSAWIADQDRDVWLKSNEGNQFLDDLLKDYQREQQQGTIREEGCSICLK